MRILQSTPDLLEVEGTWEPGGSPPPPHLHPAQDEEFEIKSGRLTAMIDGKERKLGPGETIGIARGIPHKMWNSDGETAVALWRTRPAGRTADWFATIDRLGAGGTKSPSLPALAKAVTRHSDVFRLAVVPLALRPVVQIGLRVLALADR